MRDTEGEVACGKPALYFARAYCAKCDDYSVGRMCPECVVVMRSKGAGCLECDGDLKVEMVKTLERLDCRFGAAV